MCSQGLAGMILAKKPWIWKGAIQFAPPPPSCLLGFGSLYPRSELPIVKLPLAFITLLTKLLVVQAQLKVVLGSVCAIFCNDVVIRFVAVFLVEDAG